MERAQSRRRLSNIDGRRRRRRLGCDRCDLKAAVTVTVLPAATTVPAIRADHGASPSPRLRLLGSTGGTLRWYDCRCLRRRAEMPDAPSAPALPFMLRLGKWRGPGRRRRAADLGLDVGLRRQQIGPPSGCRPGQGPGSLVMRPLLLLLLRRLWQPRPKPGPGQCHGADPVTVTDAATVTVTAAIHRRRSRSQAGLGGTQASTKVRSLPVAKGLGGWVMTLAGQNRTSH